MFAIMTVAAPITEAVDVVTWGTATGITGDSDVSTNGTLIYAYNLGASGVTSMPGRSPRSVKPQHLIR